MTRISKLLFLLTLLIAFAANSCKKDEVRTSLTTFLTRKPWNLALLQRFAYVNSVLVRTDTLQNKCTLTQTLTFNTSNTYTYDNYTCNQANKINASWSFSADNQYLNLNSVISYSDIAKKENAARIVNLGQYSLIFDTGDVNVTPEKSTDSVIIFRYGFIH